MCTRWLASVAALVSCAALLHCGGQEDPCQRIDCDRGVCDPDARGCVNPESCVSRNGADAGAFDSGGDLSTAPGTATCTPGYRCIDGTCVEDECEGESCPRGVCDPETGECVNRSSCPSPPGAKPACLEAYKCYREKNRCYDEESFCSEVLDCPRGVCSFDKLECVDAGQCSEDADCLEGDFCSDEQTCELNECAADMKECDRGICDPGTAECVNPESCDERGDCLPMHWCVEGTCVEPERACGADGCPGNQKCSYDSDELVASCVEDPDTDCRDARDCTDDRICRLQEGECADPGACSSDAHEPNDTPSEATSFRERRTGGAVTGTICEDDTDVYRVDVDPDSPVARVLYADLRFASPDVGLGTVEIALLDADGDSITSTRSGSSSPGRARIEYDLDDSSGETYFLAVRDTGDITKAGVDYELAVDAEDRRLVEACHGVEQLTNDKRSGNTLTGDSLGLKASCVADSEQIPEDVYTFTLRSRQYVNIQLVPDSGVDVTGAIRSRCEQAITERACTDDVGTGEDERLQAPLAPGIYYLIVQASKPGEGGTYEVRFSSSAAECTPADEGCVDSETATTCGPEGQNMTTQECEFGCVDSFGGCKPAPTDVCRTARDIRDDLSESSVNWDQLDDDFDLNAGGCGFTSKIGTGGPDGVYRIHVPAGTHVEAIVRPRAEQKGSLYLLDGCQSESRRCIGWSTDSSPTTGETLRYTNDSSTEQTRYIVVDSPEGTTGKSRLDVDFKPIKCDPFETRCATSNEDRLEICSASRTDFTSKGVCQFGCTDGTCTGDTCENAYQVEPSDLERDYVDFETFGGDYEIDASSCVDRDLPGDDAVFAVDLEEDEWVYAHVSGGVNNEPAIYVVRDCTSTSSQASTCLTGRTKRNVNRKGRLGRTVWAQAPATGTYYVVVDNRHAKPTENDLQIGIDVFPPQCTPRKTECTGNGKVAYCGPRGAVRETWECPNECSNGTCVDESSLVCFTAEKLTLDDQGTTSFTVDLDDIPGHNENRTLTTRDCLPKGSRGDDAFYAVEAQGGDSITVTADPKGASDDDPAIYISRTCSGPKVKQPCLAGSDSRGQGETETLYFNVPPDKGGTYYIGLDARGVIDTDDAWDIGVEVK